MDARQKPQTEKRARKNPATPDAARKAVKQPALVVDPDSDPARLEKIEKIKQALADGTYRISDEDVARKLIEHMREPKP